MKYLYKKIKSMRQLFKIDESEKKRILEMHERATRKNYLMEGKSVPCLKDDAKNQGVIDRIVGLMGGADKLCAVLGTGKKGGKNVGQGFIGEFYYKAIDNPNSYNAINAVKFYTLSTGGNMVSIFDIGINANDTEWAAFNVAYSMMSYNPSNDPRLYEEVKTDNSPAKLKSVDRLTAIADAATNQGLDPTKFVEYLVNLINNPPAEPAKSEMVKLAIQNLKSVKQKEGVGNKILDNPIISAVASAVPAEQTASPQTPTTPQTSTRQ